MTGLAGAPATPHIGAMLKAAFLFFAVAFLAPLGVSTALWAFGDAPRDWWSADRSSAGLLPPAGQSRAAAIRVFNAPTVSWRGALATHSWLVLKGEGEARYQRFDYTAWGAPIRVDGFAPDGKWFGVRPQLVFAADGEAAARAIPKIRAAIAAYPYRNVGDYRVWPGPNSNTFVAAALAAAPELRARLPATAIGRDYPYDGRWFARTADGVRVSLGGYLGATVGLSGVEINVLGGAVALDFRRPAIELPGLGRFGLSPTG